MRRVTSTAREDETASTLSRLVEAFRDWPVWGRRTVYVAVGLVLLLVAGMITAVVVARRPLPETEGRQVLADLGGEVEVLRDEHGIPHVYADTSAGRRPSFTTAAPAPRAEALYARFVEQARQGPVPVATGRFGARMAVALVNDGPVTILLDTAAG